MKSLWLSALAILFFFGLILAAEQPQREEEAKDKAKVLEQTAAPEKQKEAPAQAERLTKAEAQAVDPKGKEPLDDALTCLARTIYWEAKGEDAGGMGAIASVVMNRLGKEGFPDSVCAVVKQGHEKGECQFSWWCDGRPDEVKEEEGRYAEAKEIARRALNRQLEDVTHGALYFHKRTVTPDWAKKYVKTAEVGDHLFYKPRNGSAK